MFSYFGGKNVMVGKKHLVEMYPKPHYPLIIEPFAGAAAYSLHYHTKQVWINDYEPYIMDIWRWLQQLTPQEINALPDIKHGDDLRNYRPPLIRPAKAFLGHEINRGRASGANKPTSWVTPSDLRRIKPKLHKYCNQLQHWHLTNLDYRQLPNVEACWFIDPPYQHFGGNYRHWKMNYKELAEWCKTRKGQVIVCESGRAQWLPFKYLATITTRNRNEERVWTQG